MIEDMLPVQRLADALGLTPAEILTRADAAIEKRFKQGGYDAITGLSTGTRQTGNHSIATITPALAQILRDEKLEEKS